MLSITYPRYSFVQGTAAEAVNCYPDPALYLPLSEPSHLSFQVHFGSVPPPPVAGILGTTIMAEAVSLSESCTYVSSGDYADTSQQWQGFITARIDTTPDGSGHFNYAAQFIYPASSFDDYNEHSLYDYIDVGACFKLRYVALSVDAGGNVLWVQVLGCTQPFIRIADGDCFTSMLRYRNDFDTFDFSYTAHTDFFNAVELPVYLRDPLLHDDAKVYTRSDGSITKLYERKEEQYTLETDLLPYTWLKALDIALSHDTLTIQNTNAGAYDSINTATAFQKKDSLEIEYHKGSLTALGKATCKLLNANPVHLFSNNCS